MLQVPSTEDRVVLVGSFVGFSPEELYEHWVDPVRLALWWPRRATTDPQVGGTYRFEWPEPGRILVGRYLALAPGRFLSFSWCWDHEPEKERQVDVVFQPMHDGCRIGIFHGPFGPDEEEARQGIAEGWIHFGMLLAGLRDSPA